MTLHRALCALVFVFVIALSVPLAAGAASNDGIEEAVRQYFADIPVMVSIAQCESQFKMFDGDSALNGGSGGMIGIFQINAAVHADKAADMGMNIYMLNGNLAYARYLYMEEGTSPWMSSFPCWGKVSPAEEANGTALGAGVISTLTLGTISPEVLTLQKMLNAAGYLVAQDGPGSPGHETTKFGAATRAAVRKFQCDNKIACAGDEYSTGYGVVGVKTRAALANTQSLAQAPTPATTTAAAPQADEEQIAHLKAVIAALQEELSALKNAQELASR